MCNKIGNKGEKKTLETWPSFDGFGVDRVRREV